MRLHVVSLPHTQTTQEYSWCAFTAHVIKFCKMMIANGNEVFLYSGEFNEAPCTEHIPLVSEEWRDGAFGKLPQPQFHQQDRRWLEFGQRASAAMRERMQPGDYHCNIGGYAQKPIADAVPELACVEWGVGYAGTFAKYRAFVSYAWMHAVYGWQQTAAGADGHLWDAVIPLCFDVDEFPVGKGDGDYLLFIGRLIERKGIRIVNDIAKRTGKKLVVAGFGPNHAMIDTPHEYVGVVGPEERAKLMGGAVATLVPTQYVEAFGGVAVESMLTGTPVITTDWGAFPEIVPNGVAGYRQRTLAGFCAATELAAELDRDKVREWALQYGLEPVGMQYQDWFHRLETLRGDGWYADAPNPPQPDLVAV